MCRSTCPRVKSGTVLVAGYGIFTYLTSSLAIMSCSLLVEEISLQTHCLVYYTVHVTTYLHTTALHDAHQLAIQACQLQTPYKEKERGSELLIL